MNKRESKFIIKKNKTPNRSNSDNKKKRKGLIQILKTKMIESGKSKKK